MLKSLPATLAFALLTLTTGCGGGSGPRQGELFPGPDEVPGWGPVGKIRTFEAADLWQYIDGGAEKYIQAGVEKTLTADYKHQDGLEALVDVYVMRTSEGARAILEAEATAVSRRTELGDECRLYANSAVFRKGRYVVRLTAYADKPDAGDALVLLGRGIERRIEQQK